MLWLKVSGVDAYVHIAAFCFGLIVWVCDLYNANICYTCKQQYVLGHIISWVVRVWVGGGVIAFLFWFLVTLFFFRSGYGKDPNKKWWPQWIEEQTTVLCIIGVIWYCFVAGLRCVLYVFNGAWTCYSNDMYFISTCSQCLMVRSCIFRHIFLQILIRQWSLRCFWLTYKLAQVCV